MTTRGFVSNVLHQSTSGLPETVASTRSEIEAVLANEAHEAGQFTALGPDPWQVIWNDSRDGFYPFLEARRCVLAWRSPVASDENQPELLTRLARYAEQVNKPFFAIEVNETTRLAGIDIGLTPIWTGSECYLDLATWSTLGGKRQKVRWARSHATKVGISWREAHPLANDYDYSDLERVEYLWREERPERRTDSFLRTSFLELAPYRRYFVAEGPNGVEAFVTCSPVSRDGWYLQDVVRTPEAPRGALEGAMALALDTFRDEGFTFASNGPLPFWRPHEAWTDPDQLGAFGNQILKFLDSQYRFRGINQFRSKFEPDRATPLYTLRSRRMITPSVGRSLTQVLNKHLD